MPGIREPFTPPTPDGRLAAADGGREAPIGKNGRASNKFPGINAWATQKLWPKTIREIRRKRCEEQQGASAQPTFDTLLEFK